MVLVLEPSSEEVSIRMKDEDENRQTVRHKHCNFLHLELFLWPGREEREEREASFIMKEMLRAMEDDMWRR